MLSRAHERRRITPIVDNPDEAFSGGEPVRWGSVLTDRGKAGYHGYWGVNFYRLDEHLPSAGLDFADFTRAMKAQGLEVVLDVVANHGSPAFSMPADQPLYGELYDAQGRLVADHQNLPPAQLQPESEPRGPAAWPRTASAADGGSLRDQSPDR